MKLPGILQEIAEVAGEDAAIAIADRRGGARVLIPRSPPDDHWLVATVGRQKADLIAQHFAVNDADGRPITFEVFLPLGPHGAINRARRVLADELRAGTGAREAARRAGLTERTAWRIKKRLGRDPNQGELF